VGAEQSYLLVADLAEGWLDSARRQVKSPNVRVLLSAVPEGDFGDLPPGWELLRLSALVDQDRLREDFLQFLDDWPRRIIDNGRSFDDVFRHPAGYSVWWTGPGIERNVDAGVYPALHTLWAADQAIRAVAPDRVFLYTKRKEFATILASRCERARLPLEILEGSTQPGESPWEGRSAWLARSLGQLPLHPAKTLLRALAARLFARTAPQPEPISNGPAIVFTSQFSRCVRFDGERWSVWFWQALCDRMTSLAPRVRCRHIFRLAREFPGYRAVSFYYHTAWPLLRKIDHAAPAKERYVAFGSWLWSISTQLAALWRYSRLETQPAFRESFAFAGADISSLYVPRLREAIAGIAEWAQTVGSIVRSLREVSEVRAMVLYEELYRPGTANIAAARALGIPTIGVQHGMIMPNHLIYMLPRGQVRGGAIPDFFAATSEYAKEVICRYGAYPADRIWITGSPRFDDLVNSPPDRDDARERLGLAKDWQVVLVTTQTADWFPLAVKAVFEAAKSRERIVVCVKVHPKTRGLSSDGYRALAQQVGATNVQCFDDQFDDLLAACNVLVSASSTTILEATLLGRRTICVNFSGEPDRFPYVQDGASLPARSPQEVGKVLNAVLTPGRDEHLEAERERFLRRHAGPSAAGAAGLTLATEILRLACPDAMAYGSTALAGPPAGRGGTAEAV
jgi:hypothetical protein